MKIHPSELYLYHNSAQLNVKQTLAYAKSITRFVNEIDIIKEKVTTTQWYTLLLKLNLRAKDLLNRAHPDYQNLIAGNDWDEDSWLQILVRYPYLIKSPIAIFRDKAILCNTPTDILKLN